MKFTGSIQSHLHPANQQIPSYPPCMETGVCWVYSYTRKTTTDTQWKANTTYITFASCMTVFYSDTADSWVKELDQTLMYWHLCQQGSKVVLPVVAGKTTTWQVNT